MVEAVLTAVEGTVFFANIFLQAQILREIRLCNKKFQFCARGDDYFLCMSNSEKLSIAAM